MFGTNPQYWFETSPINHLSNESKVSNANILLICSSQRKISCDQSHAFAQKANELQMRVHVIPVNLNHGQINEELGLNNDYTKIVSHYIDRLLD